MDQLDKLMCQVIEALVLEGIIVHENRINKKILVDRNGTADQVARRIVAAVNLDLSVKEILRKKENEAMPNGVTYVDEKTKTKALRALAGKGDLDFEQVLSAVERLEEAGILFREEAESTPRGPRKKNADGSDAADPAVELPQPAPEPTVETPPVQ